MDTIALINQAFVLLLAGVLLTASITDIRFLRISNVLSLLAFFSFFPWYFTQDATGQIWHHIITFVIVFGVGFFLFSLGAFGGGDVKLLSAVALWAGTPLIGGVLLIMALSGGVLAFIVIGKIIGKRLFFNQKGASITKSKLPYGVAISCGGWWMCWQYAAPLKALLSQGVL